MVVVGGTKAWRAYGCSENKHGGDAACSNGISVRREIVENRLLAPIKPKRQIDNLAEAVQAALCGDRPPWPDG
jgi:hypothetical protein